VADFRCIKRIDGARCWGIDRVCARQLKDIPERHPCKKDGKCIFAPKPAAAPNDGVGGPFNDQQGKL
jgi:hypothetical protein